MRILSSDSRKVFHFQHLYNSNKSLGIVYLYTTLEILNLKLFNFQYGS